MSRGQARLSKSARLVERSIGYVCSRKTADLAIRTGKPFIQELSKVCGSFAELIDLSCEIRADEVLIVYRI
jgi:hypothetical protein